MKIFTKILLYFLWVSIWSLVVFSTGTIAANDMFAWFILCIAPLIISYFVTRKKQKKQEIIQPPVADSGAKQSVDSYIKTGNVTYRTDGKPISDEEVPYLIQAGFENALRRQQESTNPKYHRTPYEDELSFHFSMKYCNDIMNREEKFTSLYRTASQEKDLVKRIDLLNEAVAAFDKAKRFCYSKGKGGTIYFQDTWEYMDNPQIACYSYLDRITGDLEIALQERDVFTPAVLNVISEHDGILQKDIYCKLPEIEKTVIQRILRRVEAENKLVRIKKSGSYELHIVK